MRKWIVLAAVCALAMPGSAATNFWDGDLDGNWSSNANWVGNVAFTNGNDVVFLSVATTNLTTTLNTNRVVNSLLFNANATNVVTISGNTLILQNGISFDPLSTNHTISSTIIATNDQAWSLNSGQVLSVGAVNDPANGDRNLTVSNGVVLLTASGSINQWRMRNGATLRLNAGGRLGDTATSVDLDSTSTLDANSFADAWRGLSGSGTVSNYGVGNMDLRPQAGDRFVFSGTIDASNSGVGASWVMQGATVVGTQVFETTLPFQQNIQILQGVGVLAGANGIANLVTNVINIGDADVEMHLAGTNAVLVLDNSAAVVFDRLNDETIINLRGSGEFQFIGNDSSDTFEDVGSLALAAGITGHAPKVFVTVDAGASAGARLTANSLVRPANGGTIVFRGDNLGTAALGPGIAQILFDAAPTLSSNGAAGTPEVGILPYALGDSSITGVGSEFVTYDANGIRLLTVSEYTNALGSGAAANVELTASTGPLSSSVYDLALKLNGSGVTVDLGSNTLGLAAGAILSTGSGSNTISNGYITFGTNFASDSEGFIYTLQDLNLNASITNNGTVPVSLTKSGAGTLYINTNQFYNGRTVINEGAVVVNVNNALSTNTLSIDGTLTLADGVTQKVGMIAGSRRSLVNVGDNGTLEIAGGAGDRDMYGTIVGSSLARLIKSGGNTETLHAGADVFDGSILVQGGTLRLRDSASLAQATFTIELGGTLDVDNQPGSNNANDGDRLGNSITITMNRGILIARGSNNARSDENTGAIQFRGGFNTITLDADESPNNAASASEGDVRVTADDLIRTNRSTVLVRGDRLGEDITGTTVGQSAFVLDLARGTNLLTDQSWTSKGPGSTSLPIVPWMTAGTSAADNGSTFMTYSTNVGFRPLNVTNEFVTQTFASSGTLDDVTPTNQHLRVLFSGLNTDVTMTNSLSVLGLLLENYPGAATNANDFIIGGGNTLTVQSGLILGVNTNDNQPTELLGGTLTFGPNEETGYEGRIHARARMEVKTVIADNIQGGVTNAVSLTTDGIVIVYSNATYTGDTVINSGRLEVGAGSNVLPTNTVVYLGGNGELRLFGGNQIIGGLQGGGLVGHEQATAGRTLIINVTNANASYDFGGTIRNRAAAGGGVMNVFKAGPGTQILSGLNTYTGLTAVAGGVLRLESTNALPGGIGVAGGLSGLVFTNGGVLGLGAGDFLRNLGAAQSNVAWIGDGGFAAFNADRIVNLGGATGQVTWGSGGFVPDGSTLVLGADAATHTLDFQNGINLGASDRTIDVKNGPAAVEGKLSGNLTGTGGLTKTGAGTLALAASNDYSGNTVIAGGVLRLDDASAIPGGIGASGGSSAIILTNGGVVGLGLENFYRDLGTGAANVQWTGGGGFSAHGADRIVNLGGATQQVYWGSNSFVPDGAALVLGADSATHMVDFQNPIDFGSLDRTVQADDGTGIIDGRLSGSLSGLGGLIKTGLGTLELTGSNTYSGPTEVIAGVLLLNGPNALSGDSLLVITNFSIVGLGASDFTRSLGTNGGNVVWTGSGGFAAYGADRIVNLGGNTQQVAWGGGFYVPEIVDGSVLVLGASNSTHTVNFLNGIDLGASNRAVLVNDGTGDIDGQLGGVLSGAGGLTKYGGGTLLMSNTNLFTGGLEIRDGRLILDGGDSRLQVLDAILGSTNGDTSGRLQLGGAAGKSDQVFTGLSTAGSGSSNAVVGGAAAISTLTIDLGAGVTNIWGNLVIGGSGTNENNLALTKTGAGLLVINSVNSYTGKTVVTAGTLSITNESALGGNPASFVADQLTLDGGTLLATNNFSIDDIGRGITLGSAGGTFEVDTSRTLTVDNPIAGSGDLTKTGAGTLLLRGLGNTMGNLSVLSGALTMSNLDGYAYGGQILVTNSAAGTPLTVRFGEARFGDMVSSETTLWEGHSNFLGNVASLGAVNQQFHSDLNVLSNAFSAGGGDYRFGNTSNDVTLIYGNVIAQQATNDTATIIFQNGTNEVFGDVRSYSSTNQNGPNIQFFAPQTIVHGDFFHGSTNGFGSGAFDFGNSGDDSTVIFGSLVMDTPGKLSNTAQEFSRGDLVVSNNIIINASRVDYRAINGTNESTFYGGSRLLIEADFDTNRTDGIGLHDRLANGTLANGPDGIVVRDFGNLRLDFTRTNLPDAVDFVIGQKITIDNSGPNYWFDDGRVLEVIADTNIVYGVGAAGNPTIHLTNVWMRDGSFMRMNVSGDTVRLGITVDGPTTNGIATLSESADGDNEPFDLLDVRSGTPGVAKILQIGATNGRALPGGGSFALDDIPFTNNLRGVSSPDITLDIFNGRLTVDQANGGDVQGSVMVRAGSVFRIATTGVGTESLMGLAGNGLVQGNVIVSNLLSPGVGVGTLTVNSNVSFLATTELNFQLDLGDTTTGGGVNDLLALSGDLVLDGVLNVENYTAGTPTIGDSWTLITYGNLLTDNGLDLGTLPDVSGLGAAWQIVDTGGAITLQLVIPEPSTWALLFTGLAFFGWLGVRRRP